MALYVQVVNGLMKNFWDSAPPVPVGTDGWKNAIRVIPDIIPGRQELGEITYDLEADPVIVSNAINEITVEQRKQNLLFVNNAKIKEFLTIAGGNAALYTTEEITQRKSAATNNKNAIEAATTHDELDAIILQPIELY